MGTPEDSGCRGVATRLDGHSSTTMLLHTTGPALNALAGIGSAVMLADAQEGTKVEISPHSWIAGM